MSGCLVARGVDAVVMDGIRSRKLKVVSTHLSTFV
jgi:hypothetical protein